MLDSISSIIGSIEVKNDFSFVDTLGSFIGNRDFHLPYHQFSNGQSTPTTFTWEALSAIGNDLGKQIHTNIRDYIDLVSNIDRCKVKNIQSMFNMYSQSYNVIDNVANYPIEVQNLIDIFSINSKYLLQNDFLNDDFRQDLEDEGIITDDTSPSGYNGMIDLGSKKFNQDHFEKYVYKTFKTLISGFLDLKYNDINQTHIRKTLKEEDLLGYSLSSTGTEDEKISEYRKSYNIPSSFDEKTIVDNIDTGSDFLENYSGSERGLLELEIQRRASTLTFPQNSDGKLINTKRESIEWKTRYSYYRKAKVLEYYSFINNFFSSPSQLSGIEKYAYDQSYFEHISDTTHTALVWNDETNCYEIDENVLDNAAVCLKDIAIYISHIRERLKLQTRKNYMKGAANLLIYLVNQYMVDYAKSQTTLFRQLSGTNLSNLQNLLKTHSSQNVDVVEYFDETEYYNINTATDADATNGEATNERYWQGEASQSTGQFSDEEINNFYLKNLQLSTDGTVSDLNEFLDVIYNLGANTSYIDQQTGKFTALLSSDPNVYTITLYEMSKLLSYHWESLQGYILSDNPYEYPEDEISDQISNLTYGYISENLSVEHLSGISSAYNTYYGKVIDVSNDIGNLVTSYNQFLSNDYRFYYISSDREYCWENGIYKYDFYINNLKYTADNIYSKLQNLKRYSESVSNLTFHGLQDTVDHLHKKLLELSGRYIGTNGIYGKLSGYGYIDISSTVLGNSLDSSEQFVEQQIASRLEYLKTIVQNYLQTARDIKQQYTAAETTFTNAVNSYDDDNFTESLTSNQLYAFSLNGEQSAAEHFKRSTTYPNANNVIERYKRVLDAKTYYYYKTNATSYKGTFRCETYSVGAYPSNGELSSRVNNIINRLETATLFNVAKDSETGEYEITDMYYGRMVEGIYAVAIETRNQINSVESAFASLISELKEQGITIEFTKSTFIEKIDEAIEQLAKINPLEKFVNDTVLANLNLVKKQIITLRSDYNPKSTEYQDLNSESDFSMYMANFNFKSTEYSFSELQKLNSYISATDTSNREKIYAEIDEMFTNYNSLRQKYNSVELSIINELGDIGSTGYEIENKVEYLKNVLINDVQNRYEAGMEEISTIMVDVLKHTDAIGSFLSNSLSDTTALDQKIESVLREYDYSTNTVYLNSKKHFGMYNGLCSDSDIYYNYKNVTHPSKQYHPYLWNFIDSDEVMSLFENVFNTSIISQLEEEYIQGFINNYIGRFGQQINFWKNEGIDYTGYASRYEIGDHLGGKRGTTFHKVVDYDGPFFPDAIEFLNTSGIDGVVSAINYGISILKNSIPEETDTSAFYIEYYKPLGLSIKELEYEKNRIEKFGSAILSVVQPCDEKQIYDIYKYGLDQFDNSYCLFKQYKDENGNYIDLKEQTFKVKRNTTGSLWIRRSGYPFAYPAFADQYGNLELKPGYDILEKTVAKELKSSTYLEGNIYDFEFTKNKTAIAIIGENITDDGYKCFDSANIIVATVMLDDESENTVQKYIIADNDISKTEKLDNLMAKGERLSEYKQLSSIQLKDINNYTALDIINHQMSVVFSDSDLSSIDTQPKYNVPGNPIHQITSVGGVLNFLSDYSIYEIKNNPNISNIISASYENSYFEGNSNGDFYALVGCILTGNANIYGVYAHKHIETIDTDSGKITKSTLSTGSVYRVLKYSEQEISQTEVQYPITPTTDDVIVSMYDKNAIAFGILIDSLLSADDNLIDAYTLSGQILSTSNANGYIQNDPYHSEMNSHDVFTSDIYVQRYSIRKTELKFNDSRTFNINADISYLPVYPGKPEMVQIPNLEISGDNHFQIELLGQSRNIDGIIDSINPTPDPYFTAADISANGVFGRVYEDYQCDYEKTLRILDNPPINTNALTSDGVSHDQNGFVWTVDLLKQFQDADYTDRDYDMMQILLFNRTNFGKNPYVVCNLSAVLNTKISLNYSRVTNGFEIPIDETVDATGTYDNKNVNSIENNRFVNISGMMLEYSSSGNIGDDGAQRNLKVYFNVEDSGQIDTTFINTGVVCMCLMNTRDLSMFKYYHYLDAYGLYISAETYDVTPFETVNTNDYTIEYDQKFLDAKLSTGYWNYHFDKYGRKRYLRDINFSEYDALSDIEVLQGYKKALFKYDEELYFDTNDPNYYYPTINVKYPKTMAQATYDHATAMSMAENIDLTQIFKDNELFIIDIPDAYEIFNSIGEIRIDISTDNEKYFIGTEEYVKEDTPHYSPDDPRMLLCTLISENSSIPSSSTTSVEVGERTMFDAVNQMALSLPLSGVLSGLSSYITSKEISSVFSDVFPETSGTVQENVVYANGVLSNVLNDIVYDLVNNKTNEYPQISNISAIFDWNLVSYDIFYEHSTGAFPLVMEEMPVVETKIVKIESNYEDLEKLTRIYVNYKKDESNGNGLVLYFNYFNYINTPYIKVDDFKLYADIIDDTYLKLNPGESGILNIVVQFRYMEDGQVRGFSNVKLLSYKIDNISDDKPKFTIREIYRISEDSNLLNSIYSLNVYGQKATIPISSSDSTSHTSFNATVSWHSSAEISSIKFSLMFDGSMFKLNGVSNEDVTYTLIGPSVVDVEVHRLNANYINIPFICVWSNNEMKSYITNMYEFEIEDIVAYPVIPSNSFKLTNVNNINIYFREI